MAVSPKPSPSLPTSIKKLNHPLSRSSKSSRIPAFFTPTRIVFLGVLALFSSILFLILYVPEKDQGERIQFDKELAHKLAEQARSKVEAAKGVALAKEGVDNGMGITKGWSKEIKRAAFV
ncbi:hypothetical protein HDU97_006723 [Phlyctochytrium planicorne]|nr:hypothetical protein HDU97_006723 [Phlyctochytrium planicorne]